MSWIDLGPADLFAPAQPVCRTVAGRAIVVVKLDGTCHAIANFCPHAGKPIGQGEMSGNVLRCPYHGFAYDVPSGRNVDWPYDEPGLRRFELRERAGRIEIRLDDDAEQTANASREPDHD